MNTVLFAWELGEGLGHVTPLVAIADALVEKAHERGIGIRPVFALCDPVFARKTAADRGWPVLAAPVMNDIQEVHSRGASYADMLAMFGFGRRRDLALSLAAWDDLFAMVSADMVVADHAPTACLAARGRLPVVVTGNGFNAPPHDLPAYPSLRGDAPATRNQKVLLETVNAVLAERGVAPLARLPEILAGDARAVFSLPHLDPYAALRREKVIGPHDMVAGPLPVPETPRIFFYGRSGQSEIDEIADVLGRCGLPVSVHIRGPRSVGLAFLRAQGAEIHDDPVPITEALARASIVVSHGGGVSQAVLRAGRPQILMPNHLESVITAERVAALGVGLSVSPFSRTRFEAALERLLTDASFELRAQAVAREIAAMGLPANPPAVAADRCLEVLTAAG